MNVAISRIAAAIGEPARARILYCLMDGRAHTSTELAIFAKVSPSTASAHLSRLQSERLIRVLPQGKHRYYSLEGPKVAAVLESLHVLAGALRPKFVPNTPNRLLAARTCYDHIAGSLGVKLHDCFQALDWLELDGEAYRLTQKGERAFEALGVNVDSVQGLRRRFAYPCLDWSERRPHLGGSLAAAVLDLVLKNRWAIRDLDSRALSVTGKGRREMLARFGLEIET